MPLQIYEEMQDDDEWKFVIGRGKLSVSWSEIVFYSSANMLPWNGNINDGPSSRTILISYTPQNFLSKSSLNLFLMFCPLSLKKADDNICPRKIKRSLVQAVSCGKFKDVNAKSIDPDEVAHYELPHLELPSLQIQLFSFLIYFRVWYWEQSSR